MKKLLRLLAVSVLSVGLTTGLAAAQTGTLEQTGPYSTNVVRFDSDYDVDVDNDNDADVDNSNAQSANSGAATTANNTTAGDADSGDASNSNELEVEGTIDNRGVNAAALHGGNSGSDKGSIENTGPYSTNRVVFEDDYDVDIDNDNELDVDNSNAQTATTGDATVTTNTTGGDATTGNAKNTNTTSVSFKIYN